MTHKNQHKVAVAYAHGHDVSAKFHRSMLNLWQLDAYGARLPDGSRVGGRGRIGAGGGHIPIQSGAVIARARNKMARDFLALDGIDWLWMVDTDMTFDPDVLEQLIGAAHPTERPIVGALCFAVMNDQSRRFWPTLYSWIPGTERLRRLTQYPRESLVPVAATGGACLLIHRSVLETMAARFPEPRPFFDETPFYDLDADGNPDPSTGDEYSEDITFCLRAQACGFPVHVHTGIRTGHVKQFEATEAEFLAESAALAEARKPALPTYAVVATRDRPEMLATLRAQLSDQVDETFVFDNGCQEPPGGSVAAEDWPLHRMWNDGLDRAEKAAQGSPYNVLVVNDDVEVSNELCAALEAALRASDDHWIAYPNHQGLDLGAQPFARTQSDAMAGQTMSGWCFMLRGESGLRFDERFSWWYGDSDLERQVREAGKYVVAVDAGARHIDPLRSTTENPDRLAQAEADEAAFAEKWGVDPAGLYLAQRRPRYGMLPGDPGVDQLPEADRHRVMAKLPGAAA